MNRFIKLLSLLSFSLISISCASSKVIKANEITHQKEYAKSSVLSDLDTTGTIFYSPSSEEVLTYYSSIKEGDTGDSLLTKLQSILKENQKKVTYSSGASNSSTNWAGYYLYERDYTLSPLTASELSGNYKKTGIWVNSLYSKSPIFIADSINNGALSYYSDWDLATNSGTTIVESAFSTSAQFDREHVWPKSFGFNGDNDLYKDLTAGCDAHNLHTGEHVGNSSAHSNYPYGNVVKHDSTTEYISGITGEVVGYCGNNANGQKVFEPRDEDKGDIARSCFYMAARYHIYEQDPYNTSNYTPALSLGNNVVSGTTSEPSDTATNPSAGMYGQLTDLLSWNSEDPVDDNERRRNDLIYKGVQGNRNPFIDFPSWAEACFNNGSVSFTDINDRKVYLGEDEEPTEIEKDLSISSTEYTLLTDTSQLKEGLEIVIAAKDSNVAMSTTQNANNRGQAEISKKETSIPSVSSNVALFTLEKGTKDDTYSFKTSEGYIYAASSSANNLKTQANKTDNSSWAITFNNDTSASIVAQGNYTNNILQYNSSSSLFSSYGKTQKPVALYAKVPIISQFKETEIKGNLSFDYIEKTNLIANSYTLPLDKTALETFTDVAINDSITLSANKQTASTNTRYFVSSSNVCTLRAYANSTMTLTLANNNYVLNSIEFTTDTSNKYDSSNIVTGGSYNASTSSIDITSNSVTITFTKQITFTSFKVNYSTKEKTYSNFSNLGMNFKNEFDYTNYEKGKNYTNAGILIIKDGNASDFSNPLASLPITNAKVFTQLNYEKDTYTVALTNVPNSALNTNVLVVGFILIDGTYYFNTPKTYNVYSMLTTYQTLADTIEYEDGTVTKVSDLASAYLEEMEA